MTQGEWASWVQAIGAIVAIGVSVLVSFRLHAQQLRNADKARLHTVSQTANLFRLAIRKVRVFHEHMDSRERVGAYLKEIHPFNHVYEMRTALDGINRGDVPTAALLLVSIAATCAYREAVVMMDSIYAWAGDEETLRESRLMLADQLRTIEAAVVDFDRYIRENKVG